MLEAHRTPACAETEYYLGKAYVQNGQGRTGAEILRHLYYNYATNYTADQAATTPILRKFPRPHRFRPRPTVTTSSGPTLSTRRVAIRPRRKSIAS